MQLQFLPQLLLLYFYDTEVNCSFRSTTEVMSNHLNPLAETSVFFAACCGLTHSIECISCIVVGNTRQCLFYVFICCVLQKISFFFFS